MYNIKVEILKRSLYILKSGILYFLKFDRIVWTARIILVIVILSIPKLPMQGSALPTAVTIGVIAAFFSLFHVHSNRYVRNLINTAEEEFIRDFRHHHGLSESCEIYIVRSYASSGKIVLSHRLDGATIYPTLIFMTYYQLMDKCVLQVRTRSLLKPTPSEDFFFEIPKGQSLDLKLEDIDAKIEQALVKLPDANGKQIPPFPMKKDFHLRDLLAAVGISQYKI